MTLKDKNILLGITGSIAAYKTAQLVGMLRKNGANIRVVITKGGQHFITLHTMQALSGNIVRTDMFEMMQNSDIEHIELARWADLVLVAPASANFIARLTCGMADDLLTTLCLATTAKIAIAPAMNCQMWDKEITRKNIAQLQERDIMILGPTLGLQACGEEGIGRMVEPEEILTELTNLFSKKILQGKRVLITAGPTYEELDPVRFLGNYSSGKMGFALAREARNMGAKVTLISGPVNLAPIPGVGQINVTTGQEMYEQVMKLAEKVDLFISAAAVADYRPSNKNFSKIKKLEKKLTLELIRNKDIVADVARLKKRPFIVGFAAETDNVITNATHKLRTKKLDMVVANKVGKGLVFGEDKAKVIICVKDGTTRKIPLMNKQMVAHKILRIVDEVL